MVILTADPDTAPPPITKPTPHPRPPSTSTPNAPAAPKRTIAGKYKRRPIVYTEGSDSGEPSDKGLSDYEETATKRPRMDAIVTRSQSESSEVNNPSHTPPPDVLTLRSPVPSSQRIIDPLDDGILDPPDPQTDDQSTPSPDQASVLPTIDVPSANACTVRRATTGRVEPTTPHDFPSPTLTTTDVNTQSKTTNGASDIVAPLTGAALPKTDLRAPAITTIPQFLSITQKKNKTSIYSYLTSCEDSHFQNLLWAYIAFENAATASAQTGSFSTAKRPSQISWWVRCARVNTPPSWSNLRDYGSSVVTWWSSLQPSWRRLECGIPSCEEGPLECLFQPGINGFLNVVILTYWWPNGLAKSGAGSEAEGPRYRWFVGDVTWVLSNLLETA